MCSSDLMMPPLSDGQMGMTPGMTDPATMGTMGAPGTMPNTMGAPGTTPTMGAPTGDPNGTTMGVVPTPNPNLPPPDGAQGPPPDEVPAAPADMPQQSGSRLEKHLRIATELWNSQAQLAKSSSKPAIQALAADIEAHAQTVAMAREFAPSLTRDPHGRPVFVRRESRDTRVAPPGVGRVVPVEFRFAARAERVRWRLDHLLMPSPMAASQGFGDPRVRTTLAEGTVALPGASP